MGLGDTIACNKSIQYIWKEKERQLIDNLINLSIDMSMHINYWNINIIIKHKEDHNDPSK
jgi:hypothetical protein